MPARWTTEEQLEHLLGEVPGFLAAQRDRRSSDFIKGIAQRWFRKYPEHKVLFPEVEDISTLSPQDQENLKAAVAVRISQLKSWIYWKTATEKRQSVKADMSWLKDAMEIGNGRAHQVIEVYQMEKKGVIEPRVKAELERTGANSKNSALSVRRRVAQECWDEEHQEVKDQIVKETERRKEERRQAKTKTTTDTSNGDRSPGEYNTAIEALPSTLQRAFQAIAEHTGWVFFISAGGPNPSDEGNIYLENFYFGPCTPMGLDFRQSHMGFQEGFQKPFAAHIKSCFPKDVRHARAMRSASMIPADDEDPVKIESHNPNAGSSRGPTSEPVVQGSVVIDGNQEEDLEAQGRGKLIDYLHADNHGSPVHQHEQFKLPLADTGSDIPDVNTARPGTPDPGPWSFTLDNPPSSPIENALARLSSAFNTHTPASPPEGTIDSTLLQTTRPPPPPDHMIDPVLFQIGQQPGVALASNYHIPGAIIPNSLATTGVEMAGVVGGLVLGWNHNLNSETRNAKTRVPRQKGGAAKPIARATGEENRSEAGEIVSGKRSRKRKLDDNGDEFVGPKKGKR